MLPGKRIQNKLERIKKQIQTSHDNFLDNVKTFNDFRKFFFKTTIEANERDILEALNKPIIEFNIGEAYLSRLVGEWSKQEPSIEVSADEGMQTNPQLIKLVEDHLRYAIRESNNDGLEISVYRDQISGGWSAMKIW